MNIKGIGIDIVSIKRFAKLPYLKNQSFYKKTFDSSEIQYCLKFKNPYEHFAAKFAIKEATKKSIFKNSNLLDIKTNHMKNKPTVQIKKFGEFEFLVSVSHDAEIAVAVVISFLR